MDYPPLDSVALRDGVQVMCKKPSLCPSRLRICHQILRSEVDPDGYDLDLYRYLDSEIHPLDHDTVAHLTSRCAAAGVAFDYRVEEI